jgi:hypothetical protein
MRLTILLLFSFILTGIHSKAQKSIYINNGCSFYNEVKNKQVFVKECDDIKILTIISEILTSVSLKQNFVIYEANVENAIATNYNNERLIIIDPRFLEKIEKFSNDKYVSYLIIAHEIGHHLNAHTEKNNNQAPIWDELEADHFAGSIIHKLGIDYKTFNNVYKLIAPQKGDIGDTHPEWQARMKASINGYCESAFFELKRTIKNDFKVDALAIVKEEKKLESLLNSKIYNKSYWERNISYKVTNGKIIRNYETSIDDTENKIFKKEKEIIIIKDISRVYLRWHDPGEICFDADDSYWWDIQSKEVTNRLNPNWYFDDEVTILDDFKILLSLNESIARIQKYQELIKN